jgi:hypothetical protein
MEIFLTDDELRRLTGYKLAAYQRQWLNERRWRYDKDRLGRSIVAKAYCLQKLGVKDAEPPVRTEPNWSVLLDTER